MLLISSVVLLLVSLVNCNSDDYSSQASPLRLLFITPKISEQVYTLNQENTFKKGLNKGWIIQADESFELIAHLTLDTRLTENSTFYLFFTTNKQKCEINDSNHKQSNLYELKLVQKKSEIYSNSIRNGLFLGETKIILEHSQDQYYACIGNSLNNTFYHQSNSDCLMTTLVTNKSLIPLYLVVVFYLLLLCFSALFSGLNLGLMSLDLTELKLLLKIGSLKEQYYAKCIYPLRKRGNFLLCTILLGNVLVNATSTLILGSYLDGIFAAIGSTLFIVIFGEIIPQAVCSRHGLAIGSYTRYITYTFMALTSPLSWPLSKVLNLVLGKEISAVYTRDKVRELMKQTSGLEEKEKRIISGALDFKNKIVKDVMLSISDVFMLDIDSILDFSTFQEIANAGYSRIPVYEHTKENLIGMILIQDLLLNDPADNLPLRSVFGFFKHTVAKCTIDDRLDYLFEKLRKGTSNMAFVYSLKDSTEAVGIVTLEDLIEELVQSEIYDEADRKRAKRKQKNKEMLLGKLKTTETVDWNLFVNKVDETKKPLISPQIRKALYYILSTSVRPFTSEYLTNKQLETILKHSDFIKEKVNLADSDVYIYKNGQECDYFVVLLDGIATLEIGKEKIEQSAGLLSYFGVNALIPIDSMNQSPKSLTYADTESTQKLYVPEFSLKIEQRCVYFQISRKEWLKAVINSNLERKLSSPN